MKTTKTNVWVPTAEQCKEIRAYCKSMCEGLRRIECGARDNTRQRGVDVELNIALVAKTENWEDTDLGDFVSWSTFRKGVKLTEDGRCIIDFFLYDTWSLDTNVALYYKDGKIELAGVGKPRKLHF